MVETGMFAFAEVNEILPPIAEGGINFSFRLSAPVHNMGSEKPFALKKSESQQHTVF